MLIKIIIFLFVKLMFDYKTFIMKKIVISAITVLMLLVSCTNHETEQIFQSQNETTAQVQKINTDFRIVIVAFGRGTKHGKWPHQSCDERARKPCWRWFPAQSLKEFETEITTAYGHVDPLDEYHITINVPLYNSSTGIKNEENIKLFGEGFFQVSDEIKIFDDFAIKMLQLKGSAIIPIGEYKVHEINNYYQITVPIKYKEDDMFALVYFPLSTNGSISQDLTYLPKSDWWFGFDSPEDIVPSNMPQAVIREINNEVIILDFHEKHQTSIGIKLMNQLYAENLFNLDRKIIIDDPVILTHLGCNSSYVIINPGSYATVHNSDGIISVYIDIELKQ